MIRNPDDFDDHVRLRGSARYTATELAAARADERRLFEHFLKQWWGPSDHDQMRAEQMIRQFRAVTK